MTGGTLDHNPSRSITMVRCAGSWRQNRQAFAIDIRVVTPRDDVMYPDVVVACGERRGTDKEICDPVLVVGSVRRTAARRSKRWAYATIPSLAR